MTSTQRSKFKSRNITLSDIAMELGVSKATVSLTINGSPLVATKTCEKILKKIEELGYVYNRGAAGLSTGISRIIGLAVHDITNPNIYFDWAITGLPCWAAASKHPLPKNAELDTSLP
jgi:DNA-binding LacI/PurR family transcriptional regulator